MAKPRITIVQMIYHQLPDSNPVTMDQRFTRTLETLEQQYVRHTTISQGPNWTDLDTGWFKNECSHLILKNNEGRNWSKIPTQSQKDEVASRILDISFDGINAVLEVRPGEATSFFPIDLSKIKLRSRNGNAKISIIVLPK
jgi:hypothetical protein